MAFSAESEITVAGTSYSLDNMVPMQIGAMRVGFKGRCYSCGQFGHKKIACKERNEKMSSYTAVSFN